jgi:hypothetical protein
MKALILGAAILLAACAGPVVSSSTVIPTRSPAPSAVVASPEIAAFTGDNDINTAPFTLSGDTYISAWKGVPGCVFGAYLESPTNANFSRSLGGTYGSSGDPASGETWAYHVGGPGTFYLQVQGSCRWSLTLTAR